MELIEKLQWRYAVKAMTGEKVAEEKVDRIAEAARLAPTAYGLQPVKLFVITNQALKDQLRKASYDQPQVSDCSHLLIFTSWDKYDEKRIRAALADFKASTGREWPEENIQYTVDNLSGAPLEWQAADTAKQAFIALGVATAAAAIEGVDSCPMTGFTAEEVDKILGLKEKGLKSIAYLALGVRDSVKDWNEKLPKARQTKEQFVTEIS